MSGTDKAQGAGKGGGAGSGDHEFEEDHLLSYFLSGGSTTGHQVPGDRTENKGSTDTPANRADSSTGSNIPNIPNGVMTNAGTSASTSNGGGSKSIRFSLTNNDDGSGSSTMAHLHNPGSGGLAFGGGALKIGDPMMPSTPAVQFYAAPSSRTNKQGNRSPLSQLQSQSQSQSPLQVPQGFTTTAGQSVSPNTVFRPPFGVSAASSAPGGGIPRVPSRAPST
eukprot:CAMPEP_0113584132 /NCGR_PEP_ID=MMETSP0015_2-20120614/32927_1 /TAXON_ID=2838 /ORGANISM="Odontella" /LENGTH=221 /DNA_ID=CAMNT_0000489135 /DNA_START=394 /DNA_END=1055 /DNA_ORIENTATION=+ /assembly_acc=CAM_ASM_000160